MTTADGLRAVVVDLDGTLVRSDGTVSARTREAILEVQRRGIRVMVATGRSVAPTVSLLKPLELETPACCYNGAVIVDLTSGEWIRHVTLPDPVSADVLASIAGRPIDAFVYRDDRKYTRGARHHPPFDDFLEVLENVHRIDEAEEVPAARLTRISLYGEPVEIDRETDRIRRVHADGAYLESFRLGSIPAFRRFTGHFCDVQPPCAGKAEAIRYLDAVYGIPAEAVAAIGDQPNDRPMLAEAGLAVAVGNATDELKSIADRVIGHHDEEGVAAFLEETFLT